MDRIQQLRVYIQVMDSGNFTRAALAMNIPRSTVSTVIQQLEDRVGTQLLRRTTRRMVPTDEGLRFLETAREISLAMEEAEQMFRTPSGPLSGRLRIDMPSRIGRLHVIPALPGLLSAHPELLIEIGTTDRMVYMLSEGVDCLIRVGTLDNSDLICRKLGDLEIITCASPGYLEKFGIPHTIDDLDRHRLVNYGASLPAVRAQFDFLESGQMCASTITVNNAESYIAAARAGLGLIQIPSFDVADLLQSGELKRVLPEVVQEPMQLSFLYAQRRNVPARITLFQDWIGSLLKDRQIFARLENSDPL